MAAEVNQTDRHREEVIAGLRAFADFLDAHPDATVPSAGDLYVCDYQNARADLVERVRKLGGKWDKGENPGTYFHLIRRFGPAIEYSAYTVREEVCERVVVGTRTVQVPDPEADVPMVTKTVEDVEWRCAESLLRDSGAVSS